MRFNAVFAAGYHVGELAWDDVADYVEAVQAACDASVSAVSLEALLDELDDLLRESSLDKGLRQAFAKVLPAVQAGAMQLRVVDKTVAVRLKAAVQEAAAAAPASPAKREAAEGEELGSPPRAKARKKAQKSREKEALDKRVVEALARKFAPPAQEQAQAADKWPGAAAPALAGKPPGAAPPANPVCRDWLRGTCAFGDKCKFKHQKDAAPAP